MDVADGAGVEKMGRVAILRDGVSDKVEQANVANSLDNLLTFPRLRKRVERDQLSLHGAYFGVASGRLSVRDPLTGEFAPIAPEDYARLFTQPRF